MKLGLLGADPDALSLAREVAAAERHQLVWAGDLGTAEEYVRRLAPAAVINDEWEFLLASSGIDAVIVARGEDEDRRAEQLRKLVQERVPLLVTHPVHRSMLIYYELDMIRRESGGVLVPYLPARYHAAVKRLRGLLSSASEKSTEAPLGAVEQVIVDRLLDDRREETVLRQFAADIDLVRLLCGEMHKVSAMAPTNDNWYASLGVQLSGTGPTLARWSVSPVDDAPGARMTLLTTRGKATLWMPAEHQMWQLSLPGRSPESLDEWLPERQALAALEEALRGNVAAPDWLEAARDVELAEAIQRSLKKGRTIELHDEDYTEQATFKGTMTSLGCGVLLIALLMLPIAAVAAKLGFPWARYWAWILLALLVLFLALQGLRLVFPQREEGDAGPIGPRGESNRGANE
jgi:myo-inositol 2-dehydrogenase/D-chiro-inositol 1-dehydrogenase